MAKSKLRAIRIRQAVENPMCQHARHCENDFAISITFGEGCPKGLVISAVMQLSQFRDYHSDPFFNSIR
jgi:hypothetical protein